MLAAHCGAGEAVAEWTAKAMGGSVKFEDALAARLALIEPSRRDVADCLAAHPPRVTPGAEINPSTWQCASRRPVSSMNPRRASRLGLQLSSRPRMNGIGRDTAEIRILRCTELTR